jgi:hypothetical protein
MVDLGVPESICGLGLTQTCSIQMLNYRYHVLLSMSDDDTYSMS